MADDKTAGSAETQGVKRHHIFISYRVASDAALAERICDKLQQMVVPGEHMLRIKCFRDAQDLVAGEAYKDAFLRGVEESCLLLPLVSEGALQPIVKLKAGETDNVLLEWEKGLQLRREGRLEILPLFVGKTTADNTYQRFNAFHLPAQAPPVVAAELQELFQLQGLFINPADLTERLQTIARALATSAWRQFRDSWVDQDALGAERKLHCVQCDTDYLERSENGDGFCAYHPAAPTYLGQLPCCQKSSRGQLPPGCQRTRHRYRHHNLFSYSEKRGYLRGILDNGTKVHSETLVNYDPWTELECSVGLVGAASSELYVFFGTWLSSELNVYTVSATDIANMSPTSPLSMRIQCKSGATAEATWIWSSPDKGTISAATAAAGGGKGDAPHVCGLRVTMNVPTSPQPTVFEIRFAVDERAPAPIVCQPAIYISRGGIVEKCPDAPYELPPPMYRGDLFHPTADRPPQLNWPSRSTGMLMRVATRRPWSCQTNRDGEVFSGTLELYNLGDDSITVMNVGARWVQRCNEAAGWAECEARVREMFVGGKSVSDGRSDHILPFVVPAHGTCTLEVAFIIAAPPERPSDIILSGPWNSRSWLALNCPLLLEADVESIDGEHVYLPFEFVNKQFPVPEVKENALVMRVDDTASCTIDVVYGIVDAEAGEVSVRINGQTKSYKRDHLRRLVYEAETENKVEVTVEPMASVGWIDREVTAIIDRRCRRVAALKVTVGCASMQAVGFVVAPLYGEMSEKAPPQLPQKVAASLTPPPPRGHRRRRWATDSWSLTGKKLPADFKPLPPLQELVPRPIEGPRELPAALARATLLGLPELSKQAKEASARARQAAMPTVGLGEDLDKVDPTLLVRALHKAVEPFFERLSTQVEALDTRLAAIEARMDAK